MGESTVHLFKQKYLIAIVKLLRERQYGCGVNETIVREQEARWILLVFDYLKKNRTNVTNGFKEA